MAAYPSTSTTSATSGSIIVLVLEPTVTNFARITVPRDTEIIVLRDDSYSGTGGKKYNTSYFDVPVTITPIILRPVKEWVPPPKAPVIFAPAPNRARERVYARARNGHHQMCRLPCYRGARTR
jgi:hypothetical protein